MGAVRNHHAGVICLNCFNGNQFRCGGDEICDNNHSWGVTTIGQGGQSPPRFSTVNVLLIRGVASVQRFLRFTQVSAPPLFPNPSYAPAFQSQFSSTYLEYSCKVKDKAKTGKWVANISQQCSSKLWCKILQW